ncbi:MAG: ADP-forming succinate--CoA ligase subunit beta [Thermodesulfobacteriota bacterium]
MKLHEYQAKVLLAREGVPVPPGEMAASPQEAETVTDKLGQGPFVVKAQIHAGGRGKGGGIKVAEDRRAVVETAQKIIGMNLVTPQTGPEGKLVRKVLVERAFPVEREYYLAVTIDRSKARPVILASAAGGMEIEEIARSKPHLLIKEAIDPVVGLMPYQSRNLFFGLEMEPALGSAFIALLGNLYRAFAAYDCSLAEINPLVVTRDKEILALDAKLDIDDNALFRHKDLLEWREYENTWEEEAARYRLNYIRLDGTVGMMVNGAGMAMSTMDAIALAGARPANFLDVGGGANAEAVANGFRLILSDERVNLVFINIFGGILRCDVLAEGVINAVSDLEVKVPIVVRLEGTNKDKGAELLAQSGLNFTVARDMNEVISIISCQQSAIS